MALLLLITALLLVLFVATTILRPSQAPVRIRSREIGLRTRRRR